MADPSAFDIIRVPPQMLAALDWRPYHFVVQPFHYLIRAAHMLSMAAFFGGIALLDLRLIGWRSKLPLRPFADQVLPWLYATFGLAIATGIALFFYDPVHVGSHAYFTLKLILIAFGVSNALLFRRTGYLASLTVDTPMTGAPAHRWHRLARPLDRRHHLRLPQRRSCTQSAAPLAYWMRHGSIPVKEGARSQFSIELDQF
jgi:hypothetical protein